MSFDPEIQSELQILPLPIIDYIFSNLSYSEITQLLQTDRSLDRKIKSSKDFYPYFQIFLSQKGLSSVQEWLQKYDRYWSGRIIDQFSH